MNKPANSNSRLGNGLELHHSCTSSLESFGMHKFRSIHLELVYHVQRVSVAASYHVRFLMVLLGANTEQYEHITQP